MYCTKSRPNFIPAVGVLLAFSLSLLVGGVLLAPLIIVHILLFALFNFTMSQSFMLSILVSLGLVYFLLPLYIYQGIKNSYQNVDYQFCDNGFYLNENKFEYQDIENIDIQVSPVQKLFNLSTITITTTENNLKKQIIFKDILKADTLINRIACPL
ncbi:MAG: hypothetical protein VR72_14975 [Clostridiaceae bacterium BRH_c20a]|nr:MAG: hypothetical protein VR72_14975 [Clostridiaceae bacterium BRH_c20a]